MIYFIENIINYIIYICILSYGYKLTVRKNSICVFMSGISVLTGAAANIYLGYNNPLVYIAWSMASILSFIEYVESINRHIEYSLINGIKLYGTGILANVLEELENRGFCQVHRSYIVNFCNTKHIKRRGIMLSSGSIIPVGRTYYNVVKEKYAYWRLKNET